MGGGGCCEALKGVSQIRKFDFKSDFIGLIKCSQW